MIIDCISDLHGFYPKLAGGDLLIIGGDLTARDTQNDFIKFFSWTRNQEYEEIIIIGGNHDNYLQNHIHTEDLEGAGEFTYLYDSGTEFEGLKIWGSPWTKTFPGMNPHCKAFTVDTEEELEEKWKLIPDDIDILITHGPMLHILDANEDGYACGSSSLRQHIDRVKPKFHICGHIHEQGGNQLMYKHVGKDTWCINCSYVDEDYEPVNKPVRIEL